MPCPPDAAPPGASLAEHPWDAWTPPIRFDFPAPSPDADRRLDAWLTEVFSLDLHGPDAGVPTTGAEGWAWRVALLARECLQQCRIPALGAPRVQVQPAAGDSTGRYEAAIAFPWIEHIGLSLYTGILQQAAGIAAWCQAHPVDDTHAAACFEQIQQRVLRPYQSLVPGGKSTLPVLRTARALNIPFRHLGAGTYQLGLGSRARRLDRSSTDGDAALALRLTHNKSHCARLLQATGLPAAEHRMVQTLEQARDAAALLGWPLVVKPVDRDRGEGVSVGLRDDADLQRAFDFARQASPKGGLLVERHVAGTCHRLFMAQGRLLYAVKRRPMGVIGDGAATITALVDASLARERRLPPWRRSGLQPLDDLARRTLALAGLSPETRLEAGDYAALRPIETTVWGGVDEDVSDRVHPENQRIAALASRLAGLEIAGIDIMSEDISQPWHANGAIINEINYAPLLGGGEVSLARLPTLLRQLLPDGGRIPVRVFRGPNAWEDARTQWQHWREEGRAAYLTRDDLTLDPDGEPVSLTTQGGRQRMAALLSWPMVEALAWVETPPATP